jgi:hypothetical protein
MSVNTDYTFLGDSIFALIGQDTLDAVVPHSKNLGKKGFCLKDLASQNLNELDMDTQPKTRTKQGNNVVISIGTNDVFTFPSVLGIANLRKALSCIIPSVEEAIPNSNVTFIGLASKPCGFNMSADEIESGSSRKRRRGCSCPACMRKSYNDTFNENLNKILAEFNCMYLASPASSGTWVWKDLIHLHESVHMRYIQEIVYGCEEKAKLEPMISRRQ